MFLGHACETMGIERQHGCYFGDWLNDMRETRRAGLGAAIGCAREFTPDLAEEERFSYAEVLYDDGHGAHLVVNGYDELRNRIRII